ncbi:hypothetical protein ACFV4G_11865 [Kitasatospora sp. NPDC059747]|uniref:hypothetical protein n=1 Tax=Kitasatospora sp. NPDC059747 TaxID=3346930 RepID=UPI00364808C6
MSIHEGRLAASIRNRFAQIAADSAMTLTAVTSASGPCGLAIGLADWTNVAVARENYRNRRNHPEQALQLLGLTSRERISPAANLAEWRGRARKNLRPHPSCQASVLKVWHPSTRQPPGMSMKSMLKSTVPWRALELR